MFSILLKLKRLIKRALKVRTRSRARPDYRRERLVRLAIFSVAILTTGLLFPLGDLLAPFSIPRVGETVSQDYIAETVIAHPRNAERRQKITDGKQQSGCQNRH